MSCANIQKKKDCIQKSECDWELRTVPGKSKRKGFCVKQDEEERKKEEKIMSSNRCESKQNKKECAKSVWPICEWNWDDDAKTQSCRPEYGKRKKDGYEWNEEADDYVYNDELRKSEAAKANEKFRLSLIKKRKEKAQSQWFNAINRTKKSLKAKKNWKITREKYKKWSKIKKQWDKISKSIKRTHKAKQNWKKVSSKLKLAPQLYNVKFDYNNLKHFPFFKSIKKDFETITNNASSPLDNVLVNKLITEEIATIDDFILLNSLLDPSISSKESSKLYKSIGKSKERFITVIKICELLMVDTESKLWKYLIEHYFNLVKHNPNVLKVMSYELYDEGLAEHIMENVINELSPEEIKHFNYKCDQLSGVEEWKPGCWKDGKWTCGTRDNDNNSVEGTKYGPDHNKHNYGYNRTDLEYINGEGHKKCAKWKVDVAYTSTTRCKHCGSNIKIGTTRIVDISGARESNRDSGWTHESNFKNKYYHIDCLFREFYINATTHNNVTKYGDILGSPEESDVWLDDNEGYSVGSTQKIGWSCSHNLIESPIDYKVVEYDIDRKRRKTTMMPKTNVPQKDIQKINNLAANLRKYRLKKCKNYDRVFLDLPNNKKISLGKYKKPDINSFKEPLILDTKVYLQKSYNYKRHRILYENTEPDGYKQIENLFYGTHHKLPDWITSDEKTNKKLAKDKGLKWDNNVKLWYLPPGTDLLPFMTWLPPSVFEIKN